MLMVTEEVNKIGDDFIKSAQHFTYHFSIWWSWKGKDKEFNQYGRY